MPPNDVPTVHHIKQALGEAPNGMELFLLGDLNLRLRELQETREEELATALVDSGLGDVTAHTF